MTASGNHSAYEKNLPLFIERILLEHTDEDHAIGVTAISKELLRLYGISTSTDTVRKTLKSMADGYRKPLEGCTGDSCLAPRYAICRSSLESDIAGANKKALFFAKRLYLDKPRIVHILNLVRKSARDDSADDIEQGLLGTLSMHQRSEAREELAVAEKGGTAFDLETTLANIEQLDEALRKCSVISIGYRTGKQEQLARMLPLHYGFDDGFYYLVAIEEKDAAGSDSTFHTLRIDKITSVNPLHTTKLSRHRLEEFRDDARRFMEGSVNRMPSINMVDVILKCGNEKTARYVRENFGSRRGFRELSMDGSSTYRFEIPSVSRDGMKIWALKWLASVEIESPASLRREIIETIKSNAYGEFETALA